MELKKYDEGCNSDLGEFVRFRFSPEYCKNNTSKDVWNVGIYSGKEFNDLIGYQCARDDIVIEIASDVDGEYECVYEHGIEVIPKR